MDVESALNEQFASHIEVIANIAGQLTGTLDQAGLAMANCLLAERKIIACGEGVAHQIADMLCSYMLNGYISERPELPCISLSTDIAYSGTAASSEIFSRQIKALAQAGDILVVFTTGKHSEALFRAVLAARDKGMTSLLFDYPSGGDIENLLGERDIRLVLPTSARHHLAAAQVCVIHSLCKLVDYYIFGEDSQHEY